MAFPGHGAFKFSQSVLAPAAGITHEQLYGKLSNAPAAQLNRATAAPPPPGGPTIVSLHSHDSAVQTNSSPGYTDISMSSTSFAQLLCAITPQTAGTDEAEARNVHVNSDTWWQRPLSFSSTEHASAQASEESGDKLASAILISLLSARHHQRKIKMKTAKTSGASDKKLVLFRSSSKPGATATDIPAVSPPEPHASSTLALGPQHANSKLSSSRAFFGDDEDDVSQRKSSVLSSSQARSASALEVSGPSLFTSSFSQKHRNPVRFVPSGVINPTPLGDDLQAVSSPNGIGLHAWGESGPHDTAPKPSKAESQQSMVVVRQRSESTQRHHTSDIMRSADPVPWLSHLIGNIDEWMSSRLAVGGIARRRTICNAFRENPVHHETARPRYTLDDLATQALHAAPGATATDILMGNFSRDAPLGSDVRIGATNSTEIGSALESSHGHPQPAFDHVLNALSVKDFRNIRQFLPGFLARSSVDLVLSDVFSKRAKCTVHPSAQLQPTSSASAVAASAGATKNIQATSISALHPAWQIRKAEHLSCKDGLVVLFEYTERMPPLMHSWGMASTIATYEAASGASPDEDDILDVETSSREDMEAMLRRLDTGSRRIVAPADFPMLGSLDAGQRVTALSNNLFEAPLFKHTPKASDFLLVLRLEKSKSTVIVPASHASTQSRSHVGYLREIHRLFVVGQVEPKATVFGPAPRQAKKAAMPYNPATRDFLQNFFSYELLLWFAAIDDEYHARARGERKSKSHLSGAIVQEGDELIAGVLNANDVVARFLSFLPNKKHEVFLRFISDVAESDVDLPTEAKRGFITRKPDAPTPEDFRESRKVTLEQLCAYESFRAGEELLQKMGLSKLRLVDKFTEDALRRLQSIYDKMVERLKTATSVIWTGTANIIAGSEWECDGGFQRLRNTLEISQAVVGLLHTAPWATTANYLSFRAGAETALALQDAVGVGDPSGRGDAFSFIREMSSKDNIYARSRMPNEKREGTERDMRARTKPELIQALLDLGVSHTKVSGLRHKDRWTLLKLVQQAEQEHRDVLNSHAPSSAPSAGMFASLVTKQNMRGRTSKADQAREIQRRQYTVLSTATPPELGSDITDDLDVSSVHAAAASTASEVHLTAMQIDERTRDLERDLDALWRDTDRRSKTFGAVQEAAEADATMKEIHDSLLGASRLGTGMTEHQKTGPRRQTFPVPAELQRPPNAPLLPMRSGQRKAIGAGTQRPGSKSPSSMSSLAEPPGSAVFTATTLPDGSTKRVATGKVLRLVATSVDGNGKQIVRVTYSNNPLALKQMWLRQRHHIDLGLFNLRYHGAQLKTTVMRSPAMDPKLDGVIGQGLFPHPKVALDMQKDVTKQRDACKSLFSELWSAGMILDGRLEGRRHADPIPAKASRVHIHGTPIPICSHCHMWGHSAKSEYCPQPGADVHFSGNVREAEVDAEETTDRAIKRARTDAPETAVARPLKHVDPSDLPPASIREFCRILEELVTEALQNEAFKLFWVPVDPTTTPGYDKVVKRPMDLSTLRMNIIRRKYVTVQSFLSDLFLIHASSVAFNKEKSPITKLARQLESMMKKKIKELRKQLNLLEMHIRSEYNRFVARPAFH